MTREIRILRPHQDEMTGRVLPPGAIVRRPVPEAESLRVSGIGEIMDTSSPRRERAVPPAAERR